MSVKTNSGDSKKESQKKALILWFEQVGMGDVGIVGGKNASLGEMYQNLTSQGIKVPNGFAITAHSYHYFLKSANIADEIKTILKGLDIKNIEDLQTRGHLVREVIRHADMPNDLIEAINVAYAKMESMYGKYCDVAVRSSATAEDLPDASFAGQQETFLNIRGKHDLLYYCKQCFASLFTDRAIVYREEKGFDHLSIGLSIGVQKMVRSDIGASGVMFSIDTETGFQNCVLINSAYGLGENVVQGAVNPDEFYVFKPTLGTQYDPKIITGNEKEDEKQNSDKNNELLECQPIIRKHKGNKKIKMIYARGSSKVPTKNVRVSNHDRKQWSINDNDVIILAKWACLIEKHYKRPMDIEWAKDGLTKECYIVQARPETVQSRKNLNVLETYILDDKERKTHKLITTGAPVGARMAYGNAMIIEKASQIESFKANQILVTDMTDPDWVPIMKLAAGIITNRGGRTCHAAIVSRELGIPCIVGTNDATQKIKNNQLITIACEGELGSVYDGAIPFKVEKNELSKVGLPTDVKIMMNVGNPDIAFQSSFIPNEGVGLARMEFIINSYIKIHPLFLVNFDKIKQQRMQAQNPTNSTILTAIAEENESQSSQTQSKSQMDELSQASLMSITPDPTLIKKEQLIQDMDDYIDDALNTVSDMTHDYINKSEYFIDQLAQGIGTIAAAFYPKPVIIRMSDFKSNEYRNLIGGKLYEPNEDNPMIGWRGASRYYDPKYRAGFQLECMAIRKVRNEFGLKNLKIMIPFCRTPKEGRMVIKECNGNGLYQKKVTGEKDGLEIYVMCEIPNNVILANQFADIFDGFSIGSNDLTQLTLGIDRDSELVRHIFDERNEGIKESIKHVIKVCKAKKIKIGICGQAPSDHPDFALFLRSEGIDSISLNPDTVLNTIVAFEKMDNLLKEQKEKDSKDKVSGKVEVEQNGSKKDSTNLDMWV